MKHLKITVDGKAYDVTVEELDEESVQNSQNTTENIPKKTDSLNKSNINGEPINAPMSGNILSVNVTQGQSVNKGDVIAILEAMKMENEILAPRSGKIVAIRVDKGQSVNTNQVIAVIE